MNRRGFLQALLAIPAIAALPMPFGVAAVPALLEAEPLPLPQSNKAFRLTINGEPVAVRAMTWTEEESWIETSSRDGRRIYTPGLREGRLQLQTYLELGASSIVQAAFRARERVTVRAQFQAVEFVAEAYVCGITFHSELGMLMQQDVDLRFVTAKWVS